jgi:hypothetical protein
MDNGGETMTIRVVRDQQAPMRHEIRIRENSISTDLANDLGGEGSGPSPLLFVIGLAPLVTRLIVRLSPHLQNAPH